MNYSLDNIFKTRKILQINEDGNENEVFEDGDKSSDNEDDSFDRAETEKIIKRGIDYVSCSYFN